MRSLALFMVVVCSSQMGCSTADDLPSVYVRVSWEMAWRRFCHYVPFFAEKLSEELYDTKDLVGVVKASRIRFMNAKKQCKGKGNEKDAFLDFFVSKSENDLGTRDVDKNITILAYIKLHDYWKNKNMALLDPVFIGQVKNVEIMGKDKPDISEGMAESTRVAVGITVALIIILSIAAIALCVKLIRSSKKPPHGVTGAKGVPLHVIHSEPSKSTKQTEEPPAYHSSRRDERDGRSSYSSNTVPSPHGRSSYSSNTVPSPHGRSSYSSNTFPSPHGRSSYSSNTVPSPHGRSSNSSNTVPNPHGRSSYSSNIVPSPHGSTSFDDEYQRQKERYNGHAVRNHSSTTFEEEYEGKQESNNGYPAGNHSNMEYDYEHFGSPML